MKVNIRSASLILMFCIIWSSRLYADVSDMIIVSTQGFKYEITGVITKSDVIDIQNAVAKYNLKAKEYDLQSPLMKSITNRPDLFFFLMSQGGDVHSAIEIGRLIRSVEAKVWVPNDEVCASACVLIYAGGVFRIHIGALVVHRPYSTITGERTISQITDDRDKVKSLIRNYLNDMDVSLRLLDIMDSVRPQDSRILTDEELASLRLDIMSPALQEKVDARIAGELGLTRQEYYKFLPVCDKYDYKTKQYNNCFEILSGKH